jgi:hypothetical protein
MINIPLICGIPKTSKEAKKAISTTEVPIGPDTLARSSRAGHIYAIKTRSILYGRERSLVVYTNRERGVKEADTRIEAGRVHRWEMAYSFNR